MQYNEKEIAERLKIERHKKGLSQDELADYLSVNRNTISAWESQDSKKGRVPPLDCMLKMCAFFDCELAYLLCEQDCKTRTITDIHQATRLSQEAIEDLPMLNDYEMEAINYLFESNLIQRFARELCVSLFYKAYHDDAQRSKMTNITVFNDILKPLLKFNTDGLLQVQRIRIQDMALEIMNKYHAQKNPLTNKWIEKQFEEAYKKMMPDENGPNFFI